MNSNLIEIRDPDHSFLTLLCEDLFERKNGNLMVIVLPLELILMFQDAFIVYLRSKKQFFELERGTLFRFTDDETKIYLLQPTWKSCKGIKASFGILGCNEIDYEEVNIIERISEESKIYVLSI